MDIDDTVVKPRPVRKSKPSRFSACKCFAILCVLVVVGLGCIIGWITVKTAYLAVQHARSPHRDMYVSDSGAGAVVPLIDADTKFDVALVVYVRKPNAETSRPELYAEDWDSKEDKHDKGASYVHMTTGAPLAEVAHVPEMDVIFSDVVIRDYSLKEKNRNVTVKLELPLRRFYDYRIYHGDVRAVLLILPQSPSVLDEVQEIDTQWHKEMPRLARVDDQLRATGQVGERGSLRERAIDAMSVPFPLIYIHYNTSKDDGDEFQGALSHTREGESKVLSLAGTKVTPYLLTRSQVFIVNETHPVDRVQYQKKFLQLQRQSCGIDKVGSPGSRWLCRNDNYGVTGLWGTRFTLRSEDEDPTRSTLAYGPYLRWLRRGAGPQHHMKLPVTRTDDPGEVNVTGSESITFDYTLQLSTISPAKELLLETLVMSAFNATETSEATIRHTHNMWELTMGLLGSPADGTHPWRRSFLSVVSFTCGAVNALLIIAYWWTRETSTGIYTLVSWIMMATDAVEAVNEYEYLGWGIIPVAVIVSLPAILALRLTAPWVLDGSGWRRTLRHRVWTHRERASRRKEPPVSQALMVVAACVLSIYATRVLGLHIIHPAFAPEPTEARHWAKEAIIPLSEGLTLSTVLLQQYFNQHSGTFAGTYAISAILHVVQHLTMLARLSSRIVGRYDWDGLTPADLFTVVVNFWGVYQALTLPRVEQHEADEDEE